MNIFQKCYDFTAAEKAKAAGYYPYFIPASDKGGAETIIAGKKMLMFSRNDYLGLSVHPEVIDCSMAATKKYGTSTTASRFVSGTLDLHCELEEKLAAFLNKEDAVIFTTGMQTNFGTIAALGKNCDCIITDKLDHASIIDGCKLSGAKTRRFRHNDMANLEIILREIGDNAGKLIIVDGIYSMEGDIAPLPEIVLLAQKHNAKILLDDAHGIGIINKERGKGIADSFNLSDETDLILGTFSKSLASIGGFVAGEKKVIEYIKHFARTMIFSAALPAGSTAAALKSLEIIQREPSRRKTLWKNTDYLLNELASLGFDTGNSATPIIPVIINSQMKAVALWQKLFEKNIFTSIIIPPAVPNGRTMLRITVSALHTESQIEKLIKDLAKSGKEIGLI